MEDLPKICENIFAPLIKEYGLSIEKESNKYSASFAMKSSHGEIRIDQDLRDLYPHISFILNYDNTYLKAHERKYLNDILRKFEPEKMYPTIKTTQFVDDWIKGIFKKKKMPLPDFPEDLSLKIVLEKNLKNIEKYGQDILRGSQKPILPRPDNGPEK